MNRQPKAIRDRSEAISPSRIPENDSNQARGNLHVETRIWVRGTFLAKLFSFNTRAAWPKRTYPR